MPSTGRHKKTTMAKDIQARLEAVAAGSTRLVISWNMSISFGTSYGEISPPALLRAHQNKGKVGACSSAAAFVKAAAINPTWLFSKTANMQYACGWQYHIRCKHQRVQQLPKQFAKQASPCPPLPSGSSSLSPPIPLTAMLSSTVPCTAAQILSEAIISLQTMKA